MTVPRAHLDFATVVKVSQVLSGEMVLERLIDTLMRLAIEHAGAERGVLLLSRGKELRQEAEAITGGEGIVVRRSDQPAAALPDTIIQYVMRAREIVILEDASTHPVYSADSYVVGRKARSILCLPLVKESTITGVLYLENNLTPDVFTPSRTAVLKLLAHLASIAIERSQAEAASRRSEFYLSEGQRISGTGTFSWQVDTDEVSFSEQLRRIFEIEPNAEPSFQLISERVHPDDLLVFAHNQALVRAGLDNPEYEIRLRMPDGRVKWMRVFARVNRHEDGRFECLGAVQDVTRRRLAEEARDRSRSELAHVSRVVSLGALTASIAHEINQPLASIITNGETGLRWLDRSEPNLEKVRDLTKRVVSDARRAAGIIDRIRTMARRGTTKQSEIALAELVTESVSFLQHEFQSRIVSVSLDFPPDLPKVVGDCTQLQQVIVNLAINAVQALAKSDATQKRIAIRAQQVDAETVRCIVEDSGPGIEPEHLPCLFDSFFTTKETGMGLGLPIAQSIVEAHNGRIHADNNSALGGARFVFDLPVLRAS